MGCRGFRTMISPLLQMSVSITTGSDKIGLLYSGKVKGRGSQETKPEENNGH